MPRELGMTRALLYGLWECACLLSHFSCVPLFVTITLQSPLSLEFYRQEYWSSLLYPPSGGLHDPRIEPEPPVAPELQADSLQLSHQGSSWSIGDQWKTAIPGIQDVDATKESKVS